MNLRRQRWLHCSVGPVKPALEVLPEHLPALVQACRSVLRLDLPVRLWP